MSVGLHVTYPLFLSDFKKYSDFHENPSSGSRVVPCGKTGGQTYRRIVAFRNSIRGPSEPEEYDRTRSSFSSTSVPVNFLFS